MGKLPPAAQRVRGAAYEVGGAIRIWAGKRWHCEHGREKTVCKECGGSGICAHNRQRAGCKECGGASICEHNRRRAECKECRAAKASARGFSPA